MEGLKINDLVLCNDPNTTNKIGVIGSIDRHSLFPYTVKFSSNYYDVGIFQYSELERIYYNNR